MSSKNTCDSYHTFLVRFFLKESMSNNLIYIGSAKSPRFQLFSRHRIRVLQKLKAATKDEIVTEGQHLVEKASASKHGSAQRIKLESSAESKSDSASDAQGSRQAKACSEDRKVSRKRASAAKRYQDREHDLLLHQLRAGETPSSFSRKEKTELRRKLDQIIDRSKPPKKRLRAPTGGDTAPAVSLHVREAQVAEAIEDLQDKNVYTTITRLVTFLVFFADGGGSGSMAEVDGGRRENGVTSHQDNGLMSLSMGRQISEDGLEEFSAHLLQDMIGTFLPNEFFECGYESGARSTGTAVSEAKSEAANESKQASSDAFSGFDALKQAVLETGKFNATCDVYDSVRHERCRERKGCFERELRRRAY